MSLRPRVDARAFRQFIDIEVRDKGQDESGQQNRDWYLLVTIRGDLHSVNGREFIAAQAEQAEATHLIETRWRQEFEVFQAVAAMRARVKIANGATVRIFDITTCDNVDQMNRLCRMMASEGLKQ